jgi:peptidoglycan/LPS O-acetylase OafA/YrhL
VEQWQAPVNGANRFAHVDALRAFAILVVVVAHAGLDDIVPGGSGVTIFFGVSGFIITHLVLREHERTDGFSPGQFYLRRAIKIVPPFLVAVILPTILYGLRYHISASDVLTQVFFVFNWISYGGDTEVLPGTGVMWSLAIEEQFYIVFALLWVVALRTGRQRRILIWCAAIAIAASTIARVIFAADSANDNRIFYGTDTRLDGIALGVLTAFAYESWRRGSMRPNVAARIAHDATLVGAVAVYVFTLVLRDEWFRDTFRYSLQAIAACAVVLYGLLPGEGPWRTWFYKLSTNRLVSLIGLASYSIYLVHQTLGYWLIGSVIEGAPRAIRVPVVSVAGIALGIVIYQLLEIPVQRLGRRLRRPEPTSPAPADGPRRPAPAAPTAG